MGFEQFYAAIAAPDLQAVARVWAAGRHGRRMPAFRDLDPADMPRQLANVWCWTYDRGSGAFTGRLAGEAIEQIFGRPFRGAAMRDVFPADQYDLIYERHHAVVAGPRFCHGKGRVFLHLDRLGIGERIIMPLAEDGVGADAIFGATVYSTIHSERQAAHLHAEEVTFYDLDPAP